MASPQLDDGFVHIANALLDAILLRDFSKRELVLLGLILRQTDGAADPVRCPYSARAFRHMTGLDESTIRKTIKGLIETRVLRLSDSRIGINPTCPEWRIAIRARE